MENLRHLHLDQQSEDMQPRQSHLLRRVGASAGVDAIHVPKNKLPTPNSGSGGAERVIIDAI
jgi:hypothetical protein